MSAIYPNTVQAYQETEYIVHAAPEFTLQIGRFNPDLLRVHRRESVNCSAFLTAFNPFSEPLDDALNATRQANLTRRLTSLELAFLPGIGKHPSNDWPGEDSVLVLGLTLEEAKALGSEYQQNGFVWSGADALPQLILLR